MRVLDLFSGIGGFSLGLEMASPEFETVAFCEQDEFCQKVLKKHWPDVPIFDDVRTLDASGLGRIDLICGGFPCQDISVLGKRAGLEGEHSGLWAEFFRIICYLRPRFIIVENSPSLLVRGMGGIVGDLASIGYDCEWEGIPAAACGAHHLRARQWVLSYPACLRNGMEEETLLPRWIAPELCPRWPSEPGVGRVAHGVPSRVDRLKALGNAVVPQVVQRIGEAIIASSPTPQENTNDS